MKKFCLHSKNGRVKKYHELCLYQPTGARGGKLKWLINAPWGFYFCRNQGKSDKAKLHREEQFNKIVAEMKNQGWIES